MSDIAQQENDLLIAIASAKDEAGLEAVRVAALGKSGSVSALLKTLGAMTPDQRKVQGPAINGLKDRVTAAIAAAKDALGAATLDARLRTETVDVTLPVRDAPVEAGRVHPISQVTDELTAIFADMGFAVAEGPDIETDDYNFTKLNFPEGHPAREMHDTFYFSPKPDGSRLLLRTHTSPVQVRTMLTQKPPIRVIIPGLGLVAVAALVRTETWPAWTILFDTIVVEFVFGVALAKWTLQGFRLPPAIAGILVLVGFASILIAPMVSENTRVLTWGIPAFAIVAGAVSLESFVAPGLPRWLLTLGDASYSIYLSHGFVLPALGLLFSRLAWPGLWPEGLTIILCLLFGSLVGWGVFILIESPMLRALRRGRLL